MYVRRWVSWARAGLGVDGGKEKTATQLDRRYAGFAERRDVRRQPSVCQDATPPWRSIWRCTAGAPRTHAISFRMVEVVEVWSRMNRLISISYAPRPPRPGNSMNMENGWATG